jgi:hypothetical protein
MLLTQRRCVANDAMTMDTRTTFTALIVTIITVTIMTITLPPGATRMDRSRLNWLVPAVRPVRGLRRRTTSLFGAIIVLIFLLAQDLFWTGIVATLIMGLGTAIMVATIATVAVSARNIASRVVKARSGLGTLVMRAIELGAAALIVAFGVLLLVGYMASEQLWMFTG